MSGIVLIGAGGHCKTVIDILKKNHLSIYGVTDPDCTKIGTQLNGVNVVGSDDMLPGIFKNYITKAIICVGSIGDNTLRSQLYHKVQEIGFSFINAVHPAAVVSDDTLEGTGTAVMAGVIVNPEARIGSNVVLNTGCIIEHGVVVNDNAFIAPGAIIAGESVIGRNAFIGLGAKVIQGVSIGKNALIAAGALVLEDVPDDAVVMGLPGRIKGFRKT